MGNEVMGNLNLHQKVGTSKIAQMEEYRKSEHRSPRELCEVQETRSTGRDTKVLCENGWEISIQLLIANQFLQLFHRN